MGDDPHVAQATREDAMPLAKQAVAQTALANEARAVYDHAGIPAAKDVDAFVAVRG